MSLKELIYGGKQDEILRKLAQKKSLMKDNFVKFCESSQEVYYG